ncbi:PepSY domain-containing protein [Nitrospira sp. KM1]|uniref:PepSY domain-containing protein n=1 Tax=Nitrospira sp. KM1 TaxID=1936990 RepID=UPI001566AA5C|nr:PepSY domain-containing protein [Nitrospira sp. KM1]
MKDRKKKIARAQASSLPIDQAIEKVQRKIRGVVTDASLKGNSKDVHWRVKVLTPEGFVKVYVDAHSGEILEAWAEDES